MQRSTTRVLTMAAGIAAVATIAVTPLVSSARPAPTKQVVTFQEPNPQVAVDDTAPQSKIDLGDRLSITGPLENARHQPLGRFAGSCTVIGTGSSLVTTPMLCEGIYKVAGGQIATMGMMTLTKTNLVIIGGSGAYSGVHGRVTPGQPAQGFTDADKLTIEH